MVNKQYTGKYQGFAKLGFIGLGLILGLMLSLTYSALADKMTKQQLADMSGLRVETVIRILKKVEEKGLINTHRGNIVCNNISTLLN